MEPPDSPVAPVMRRVLLWLGACYVCGAPLHAQRAPVLLEAGHWTYDAVRRLNVAGLAPAASDPALAPVTRTHAHAVFAYALKQATQRGRSDFAGLAQSYLDRLRAEGDSAGWLAGAELRAGWTSTAGEARAGEGWSQEEDWVGAQPLRGGSGPAAALRAHGFATDWLSWSFDGGRLGNEWTVPAATAGVRIGVLAAWAGRRALHYGVGRGGGTVRGTGWHQPPDLAQRTTDTFDGVGLYVREPFHLPWYLRYLGPVRIEIAGGMLDHNGKVDDPYLVFGRLVGMPFTRRFTLGINRGAIFGGAGNPITTGRLLGLLIGLHGGEHGEFENQVFSTIMRVRPPFGELGVELYAEFGMDDTAGAIRDVPGIVAGVDIAAIPGLPALALGIEHTDFPHDCCSNTMWYRNVFFRGSWSDDGLLFAHPLGGHGREWLAHARLDLPARGVLLRIDAFTRERGAENLFAPERQGRSRGASASVHYSARNGFGLRADGSLERAEEWRSHRAAVLLTKQWQ